MKLTVASILSKIDLVFLTIISLASIIVGFIDLFDWNDKISALKNVDYALIGVVILSTIGLHLVTAHYLLHQFQERTIEGTEKIISSIQGVKIKYFDNMVECEEYLANRVLEAKNEVCDLTWQQKISRESALPPRQKVSKKYDLNISKVSKNVIYREVFIFNNSKRLEKLKKRLHENRAGYSCKYFPEDSVIPRLQFVLIDNTEVIFASSTYTPFCAIQHPALCSILKIYYESVWEKAVFIKDGDSLNHEIINTLFK